MQISVILQNIDKFFCNKDEEQEKRIAPLSEDEYLDGNGGLKAGKVVGE